MRVKRLDEILEECIAAGFAGRSVEESLALYPAVAGELEPLLRTALDVSGAFQSYTPPAAVEERGLSRFLDAAADRRSVRRLTGWSSGWRWPAFLQRPALAGLSAAAAVAVIITAAVAGGVMLSSSGDDSGDSTVVNPSDTAPVLDTLQEQVAALKARAQGEDISPTDAEIVRIHQLIAELKSVSREDLQTAAEIDATLVETYTVLSQAADANPDVGNDPAVRETLDSTRDLAGLVNVNLPIPVGSAPTPPPAATPTPAPSAPSATTPPVIVTEPPTAPPTATPDPTAPPTPTATADNRFLPGFNLD
jgi:hypothetical protein